MRDTTPVPAALPTKPPLMGEHAQRFRVDAFVGDWHVREYAYSATGRYLGSVRQRRRLEQLEDHRVRVIQDCTPDAALDGTAMARFRGHHEFIVDIEERVRHYRGPAVVGTGVSFGEGVMLGRGVWPWFGHSFRSFSVMSEPDRQLTGGSFFRATDLTANIVGVATPAVHAAPTLVGPEWPGDVGRVWQGTRTVVDADGTAHAATQVTRFYDAASWRENDDRVQCEPAANTVRVSGVVNGFGIRFGPMLELEGVAGDGAAIHERHVLDASRRRLICIRRVTRNEVLRRVEVVRLHTTGNSEDEHE